MEEIKELFSRIKFTYRRTNNLTKMVVTAAIVFSMVVLIALHVSMTDIQRRTEDLREQAAALEYENQLLDEKIDELGSVKSIVEIAEEELDMVQPGSVVIEPES